MTKNKIKRLMAATAAITAFSGAAHGQSADAIIDKLVEKGILTTKEAQDLREESDKGFNQAYAVKSGMSDWVQALKFNGDIRGRFEYFNSQNDGYDNRQRYRYRLRFGVTAVMNDNLEAGFRLASGESNDPISSNQSLQDNGSKKDIFVDLAYGRWTPLNGPDFIGGFTIGKMENPFVFSDLVFDGDYTPEGAAANWGYIINDQHTLKLNSGIFVLDELSASQDDPYLAGAQARWDAAWSAKFNTTLGAAYLDIVNANSLSNSVVPNSNRGNTRNANGALVYDYHPVVVDAAATYTLGSFPMYAGPFPIKLAGDYMNNEGAPSSADNYGYSVGIQFGKSGKKGTWDLAYTWKWLGANAWYEELVDSDFGAYYQNTASPVNLNDGSITTSNPTGQGYGSGANVKGHIVRFAYSPTDSFTFSVKWFLTELINEYPKDSESEMNRLQVDAVWKF